MNGINYPSTPVPDFLSHEECELLKRTLLKAFPEDEQQAFIRICQRTKLDPFVKQIYATKRYQKVRDENGNVKKVPTLVPVCGILGLCAVADRTGNYDGCEISWSGPDGTWKDEWLSEEYPAAAKCVVHRKGRQHPEVAIARWFSYVGQNWDADKRQWVTSEFWDKMPDYMLGKVAKAAALRGAFPDPLSNVFIREELDSNLSDETEAIPTDEAKVAENQRRDEETKKRPPAGVRIIEGTGKKPSPAEALEPGLEQDKIPAKPKPTSAPAKPVPVAVSKATASEVPDTSDDDLDMSSPGLAPGDVQEQEPAAQTPSGEAMAAGAAAPVESAAPWREHVIMGVQHVKFFKRKVGELNAVELGIIENQWLPTVRQQWEDATEAQRADANAFEAAIAYGKMAKPW
jgi:phage recombination protein Bet